MYKASACLRNGVDNVALKGECLFWGGCCCKNVFVIVGRTEVLSVLILKPSSRAACTASTNRSPPAPQTHTCISSDTATDIPAVPPAITITYQTLWSGVLYSRGPYFDFRRSRIFFVVFHALPPKQMPGLYLKFDYYYYYYFHILPKPLFDKLRGWDFFI